MQTQLFLNTEMNPLMKPVNELMELNLKTIQRLTYMTPVDYLSVRKPEDILHKQVNALVKNAQTLIDYTQDMFHLFEDHLFENQMRDVMVKSSRTPVKSSISHTTTNTVKKNKTSGHTVAAKTSTAGKTTAVKAKSSTAGKTTAVKAKSSTAGKMSTVKAKSSTVGKMTTGKSSTSAVGKMTTGKSSTSTVGKIITGKASTSTAGKMVMGKTQTGSSGKTASTVKVSMGKGSEHSSMHSMNPMGGAKSVTKQAVSTFKETTKNVLKKPEMNHVSTSMTHPMIKLSSDNHKDSLK
ncbi:hypothetical protein [Legionella worsleiensis]|uniref:hypothetical protein n=1 Tax=Legionella worsleiensis TaxID=45076 RepID=UPI0039EA82D3